MSTWHAAHPWSTFIVWRRDKSGPNYARVLQLVLLVGLCMPITLPHVSHDAPRVLTTPRADLGIPALLRTLRGGSAGRVVLEETADAVNYDPLVPPVSAVSRGREYAWDVSGKSVAQVYPLLNEPAIAEPRHWPPGATTRMMPPNAIPRQNLAGTPLAAHATRQNALMSMMSSQHLEPGSEAEYLWRLQYHHPGGTSNALRHLALLDPSHARADTRHLNADTRLVNADARNPNAVPGHPEYSTPHALASVPQGGGQYAWGGGARGRLPARR
jgi:hypothetical protein